MSNQSVIAITRMKNVNIEYFVEMDTAPPGPEFRHKEFDVELKKLKTIHRDLLEPFQNLISNF